MLAKPPQNQINKERWLTGYTLNSQVRIPGPLMTIDGTTLDHGSMASTKSRPYQYLLTGYIQTPKAICQNIQILHPWNP